MSLNEARASYTDGGDGVMQFDGVCRRYGTGVYRIRFTIVWNYVTAGACASGGCDANTSKSFDCVRSETWYMAEGCSGDPDEMFDYCIEVGTYSTGCENDGGGGSYKYTKLSGPYDPPTGSADCSAVCGVE
jgi:hypothetical protein